MTRYILLRDRNKTWRREARGLVTAIDAVPDPALEIAELGPNDLRLIAHDADVLAFAPSMPTRQVSAIPLDDPRPEEARPGWGAESLGIGADRSQSRIALLDTGIDLQHAAFEGLDATTEDFVGTGLTDVSGHGTHLAGTVVGRPIDAVPIGLLPRQRHLVVGKVLTDSGLGISENFLAGVIWAASVGAKVIGFALTLDAEKMVEHYSQSGQPETLARSAALRAQSETLSVFSTMTRMLASKHSDTGGVLILAAAGNDSRRMIAPDFEVACTGLAADPGVIAVGAVQHAPQALQNAAFSNTNPDVVAPGVGIVSAAPDAGLRPLNGTSMAMAHATAVAALWADRCARAEDARADMIAAATLNALSAGAAPYDFGAGLVQAPKGPPPSPIRHGSPGSRGPFYGPA